MTRDDVFRCPAIGRYLSVGACLRRQVEPRLVTVVVREASEGPHGTQQRITEQRPAGPAYPDCAAGTCELGRRHAAADLEVEEAPRRPAPEPGGRVWSDELPDVPIGPPPATSAFTGYRPLVCYAPGSTTDAMRSALAARRARREAAEAATRQPTSSTDTPAGPAPKEETMPSGVRAGGPCKGCGAKGARCKAGCPTKGAAAAAAPKAAAPAKRGRRVDLEVRKLDADALLARRDALLAELAAVEEQLAATLEREEARIDRLREAVAASHQRKAA